MVKTQDNESQTLIVSCTKFKLKMSRKMLVTIKKCLALVIIELNQNIMVIQTK